MITRSIFLPRPPPAAFALFTERASEWWPTDRRHTKDPKSIITLASTGRFSERSGDHEVQLGKVRVWDPPQRLLLDWYPGTDVDHPTEVEIRFTAEGEGTRVTVEHRPLPVSAPLWKDRAPRYEKSWDSVFAALVDA